MITSSITLCGLLLATALTLPASAQDLSTIEWQTNYDDPPIGDPAALKGGTFHTFMTAYPLTLRLVGPNSNDGFSSWKRAVTMDFGLVARHPPTDNNVPRMASGPSTSSSTPTPDGATASR